MKQKEHLQKIANLSEEGLMKKFNIERTDGRRSEKDLHSLYFVLNYVGDRHARVALTAYAESCQDDYPELSKEIVEALDNSWNDYCKYGMHHNCKDSD